MAKAIKKAVVKKVAKKVVPKKVAVKKVAEKKTEVKIKYEDKSAGQPELVVVFNELVKLMKPYAKAPIELHGGTGGKIILVSRKPVEIDGRKRDELWFAAALVQKGYVGFYYMPIYGYEGLGKKIHPELMKCLKGKACFHIKKYDEKLFEQIKEALQLGYDGYKKLGWI
jgi:hypothetical protein